MFGEFKKGSGGKYVWDKELGKLVKVKDAVATNDAGFNGPVWFPKGGTKYFDKALQKTFYTKEEKKTFMKENKLVMDSGNQKRCRGPEAGLGKIKYFHSKRRDNG